MSGIGCVADRDALCALGAGAARVSVPRSAYSGVALMVAGDVLHSYSASHDMYLRAQTGVSSPRDGYAAVLAADLHAAVTSLRPGAVAVSVQGDGLSMRSGESWASVPLLGQGPPDGAVLLPSGGPLDLGAGVGRVIHAVSVDPSRPILTGVLVEPGPSGVRLTATDSYRLASVLVPGITWASAASAIVPARAWRELAHLGQGVSVGVDDVSVSFRSASTTLCSRLIEGAYPRYAELLPAPRPHLMTVDVAELDGALARVAIAPVSTVRIILGDRGAELESVGVPGGRTARDWVACSWDGPSGSLGMSARYLRDALAQVGTELAALSFAGPLDPVLIRPEPDDGSWWSIVMPTRL